jgi:fructokinase
VIAVVGESLFDAHIDGDGFRLFPGGGPFNTSVALARLGIRVCYLGAVSRDRLGERLMAALVSAGVETSRTARVDAPTPLAIVEAGGIEPSYSFYLAGTAHEALGRHLSVDSLDGVTAVHIGTLALTTDPPGAAVAAFAEDEAQNRVFILDPNVRPTLIADRSVYMQRLERLIAVADLIKLSDSDLAWLYPDADALEDVERFLDMGAGCVVLTYGERGAEAWTGSVSARVRAVDVTVVDTIGAGDAFGAGLLAWLRRHGQLDKRTLRGLDAADLEAALGYAAAVGAAQCTRSSAWGATKADVDELLHRNATSPT